ncbi:MAG: hypothetical protein ACOYNZ_10950 [Rhodoferax sp.]
MPLLLPFVLAGWLCAHYFSAGLVFGQQYLGFVDATLLVALGTASEQNDEGVAVFGKVNPVAWTLVNDVFAQSIKPLLVWA